jgi:hypothetical protein
MKKTLWMLQYHLGEPVITCHTMTYLEFFYAEDRVAAQKLVNAFGEWKRASSCAELYQELLAPCEQGAIVARRFLPGEVSWESEQVAHAGNA